MPEYPLIDEIAKCAQRLPGGRSPGRDAAHEAEVSWAAGGSRLAHDALPLQLRMH